MTVLRRLRRRLAREDGYTLMELLLVISIFGTITGALTSLFVAATNAEVDSNRRFQSQQEARLAFDQLRRDIHCASSATVTSGSVLVLTLPGQCPSQPTITWCAVSSATNRYRLYRRVANPSACGASDRRFADFITSDQIFTDIDQSTSSLAKVRVLVKVNAYPAKGTDAYNLQDEIVLRNSSRS